MLRFAMAWPCMQCTWQAAGIWSLLPGLWLLASSPRCAHYRFLPAGQRVDVWVELRLPQSAPNCKGGMVQVSPTCARTDPAVCQAVERREAAWNLVVTPAQHGQPLLYPPHTWHALMTPPAHRHAVPPLCSSSQAACCWAGSGGAGNTGWADCGPHQQASAAAQGGLHLQPLVGDAPRRCTLLYC